jgi:hypothetical protein
MRIEQTYQVQMIFNALKVNLLKILWFYQNQPFFETALFAVETALFPIEKAFFWVIFVIFLETECCPVQPHSGHWPCYRTVSIQPI